MMFHEFFMFLIPSVEINGCCRAQRELLYCMKLISHLTEHNDPGPERLVCFFLFQRNDFQKESMP